MRGRPRDVAAIVVTYLPTASMVRNLHAIAAQVEYVLVIDNTPGQAASRYFLEAGRLCNVHVFHLGANVGIGAALNIGMEIAHASGYEWAFTFDQDSFPGRGAAAGMRRSANAETAIVAPLIRSAFNHQPMLRKRDSWFSSKHDVVITSGNLVRIAAWRSVGGFDWRLFLDAVDFDFCLRLAKLGWRIVRAERINLVHRLGAQRTSRILPFLKLRTRAYPPIRRYFQARNTITILLRHAEFSPAWSFEHALKLISTGLKISLLERKSRQAWLRGLASGFRITGYPVEVVAAKMPPLSRNRGQSAAEVRRLAQYYKRMLDEFSTFPQF